MRTYAPAATETVLDRLLEEPSLAAAVKHHARLPERDAITAPFPPWLDRRIVRITFSPSGPYFRYTRRTLPGSPGFGPSLNSGPSYLPTW